MRKSDARSLMFDNAAMANAAQSAEALREAERRDIARELHDTVVQPLTALVTSFEWMQRQPPSPGAIEGSLGAWKELAQEAIVSLRATLSGLRTHPHARVGLPEALRRYLAPQIRSGGLRLAVESHDWPEDLPIDCTSGLYLTVREALTNAQKHARATDVTVLMRGDAEQLRIIVADNGVGFREGDLSHAPASRGGNGLGIVGMSERAHMLGGQLVIATALGQGTRVEITVPRPSRVDVLRDANVVSLPGAEPSVGEIAR